MNVRAACMRSGVVRRVRVEYLYLLLVQICAADRDDNESRRGNLEKAAGPGPPTAKNGTSRLLHASGAPRGPPVDHGTCQDASRWQKDL